MNVRTVTPRQKFVFWVALFVAVAFSSASTVSAPAQTSTPVSLAQPSPASTAFNRVVIPDSRSAAYRAVELILNRPSPLPQGEIIEAQRLVKALTAQGITVLVDSTAIDDSWSDQEKLQVPFGELPLRVVLLQLLKTVNATIFVDPDGVLKIISMDNFQVPEFLHTVMYDVSALVSNLREGEALTEMLSMSHADTWADYGVGEGTLTVLHLKQHIVLSVTSSYEVQYDVRRQLANYAGLTGVLPSAPIFKRPPMRTGATPVELPRGRTAYGLPRQKLRALPYRAGSFFGVGVNESAKGGGGGVF